MPLLEPKPGALRPRGVRAPAPDRLPGHRSGGTPEPLRTELTELLGPEKVLWKVSDLVRYASDASPYRFVPQVVVIAEDIDDISAVLSYAHGRQREVVFRAAGTSLNGQAQGEDILVDVRRHWAGIEVLEEGGGPGSGPAPPWPGPTRPSPGTAGSSAPTRPAPPPAPWAASSPTTRPA